jgi:uncharacterized protein (TIRG00374 family)
MRSGLRSPRVWLGIGVSVVALVLATRGVSWSEMRSELAGAHYGWLAPAALTVVLGQLARTSRWQSLFGAGPTPAFVPAFAILSVGYLVSYVLPLRLGDLVRAWLVGTTTPAGTTEALATIVLERVVDLLTIVGLVAVLVPDPAAGLFETLLGPGLWTDARAVQVFFAVAIGALYLGLVALAVLAEPAQRAVAGSLARLGVSPPTAGRVGSLVGRFLLAVAVLRRPRTAGLVALWSVVVWLLGGLQVWLVMRAFQMELSFGAAMFVLGATAVAAILPSSPGYLGVFHQAVRLSVPVVAAAVPLDRIVSFAFVLHGLTTVVLLVLGVVGLLLLGMSFSDVVRRAGPGPSAV